jgi:hypothetical protein
MSSPGATRQKKHESASQAQSRGYTFVGVGRYPFVLLVVGIPFSNHGFHIFVGVCVGHGRDALQARHVARDQVLLVGRQVVLRLARVASLPLPRWKLVRQKVTCFSLRKRLRQKLGDRTSCDKLLGRDSLRGRHEQRSRRRTQTYAMLLELGFAQDRAQILSSREK